jgi:hypothetical protein
MLSQRANKIDDTHVPCLLGRFAVQAVSPDRRLSAPSFADKCVPLPSAMSGARHCPLVEAPSPQSGSARQRVVAKARSSLILAPLFCGERSKFAHANFG